MLLSAKRRVLLSPNYSNISRIILMGSKHFLLPLNSTAIPTTHVPAIQTFSSSQSHIFHSITTSNKHFSPRPITGVDLKTLENQMLDQEQLMTVRQKLDEIGIDGSTCMPGQFNGLVCPNCKGGSTQKKSLSLYITEDGGTAMWTCFRAKCGWRGTAWASADAQSIYGRKSRFTKVKQPIREITEESLGLEPLCNELLAHLAERMISKETLQRNAVMQKRTGDQTAIAFTYRRKKVLVSCKYRSITKRFWQESKDANEVLIHMGPDALRAVIENAELYPKRIVMRKM